MSDLAQANGILRARFPSCIQQIINPGKPTHGQFFIVGSIPADCYDMERRASRIYATVEMAIDALTAAGVRRFQMPDCTWKEVAP